MSRLEQLYKKLGLNQENGLFFLNESNLWVHKFPYRISKILKEVIKPAAFFCIYNNEQERTGDHPKPFNESFILFFDNPTKEEEILIHKRVINFGLAQAIFINRDITLDLYHGNEFTVADFKTLKKLKEREDTNDFEDFSFINILLGNSLKALGEKKNQIDWYLLTNITDARRILVAKDGLKLLPKAANRLIGRLLFVSYLIDRDVTFSDQQFVIGSDKAQRKNSFKNLILKKRILYNFFKYLNDKYNGDIFPLKEYVDGKLVYDEENAVNDSHLNVLFHLFNCSKLFISGKTYKGYHIQRSLFDLYDFEIIPVELISSIYENFIGNEFENEKLRLSKQKSIKAYYTPSYLVDYVLSQTVTPFLENKLKTDSNCKVLDPSCGSGIFLVETLRKIIEKELTLTKGNKISDNRLWQLIKSNIYGIDIDSDAIDISIFSLYVTILDYKQPAEIEKFKFQKLKNENFFGGIEADFFNITHEFNSKIKGLDFIIGNPPWGKVSNSRYLDYIKDRKRSEIQMGLKMPLEIGDKEICQAFLIRTSDFAEDKKNTKCSFIVSSKVLYNTGETSKKFRAYFLHLFHIKQVVELSPVNNKIRGGNHVFENARYPAAIITFVPEKENNSTHQNIIQHITIKPNRFFLYYKTILVEKHDVKNIKQEYFIEDLGGFDWLWKVLVHGNALDIHFIKRLKDLHTNGDRVPELEYEWKGGLKLVDSDKKLDTTKILNYNYINAGKGFRPYLIITAKKWKEEIKGNNIVNGEVGYLPEIKFFQGSKLLFKKGVVLRPRPDEHFFGAVTAFNDNKVCFTSTIGSLIPKNRELSKADNFLSSLSALFNSRLFTYFILHTGSSLGVEKSRIHFDEFFKFPVKYNQELGELALTIANKPQLFEINSLDIKQEIEKIILKNYGITDVEKSLIDYALNVSIPVLLRQKSLPIFKTLKLANQEDYTYMQEYVAIFLKFFKHRFETIEKSLSAEILYSQYFIRINFHLNNRLTPSQLEVTKGDNDLNDLLGDLGIYNVCRELYFQQDVRGFTKNSFYIIKPNERKLWHQAVAHLDVLEFDEEITKAVSVQTKLSVRNERN